MILMPVVFPILGLHIKTYQNNPSRASMESHVDRCISRIIASADIMRIRSQTLELVFSEVQYGRMIEAFFGLTGHFHACKRQDSCLVPLEKPAITEIQDVRPRRDLEAQVNDDGGKTSKIFRIYISHRGPRGYDENRRVWEDRLNLSIHQNLYPHRSMSSA